MQQMDILSVEESDRIIATGKPFPDMTPRPATDARATGPGTVQGILARTIHYSSASSFCVARITLDDGDDDVTIKGVFPELEPGVCYQFVGEWQDDPRFGRQLKVKSVAAVRPSTLLGIERYLAHGPFPHIGPSRAHGLVEKWGLATLDHLDADDAAARLAADIPGITPARAEPIVREWRAHRERNGHMTQLYSFGMTPWQISQLVRRYGERAAEKLLKDPYQVIGEIPKFGFLTVDSIAARMGIAQDDLRRARAAVLYLLEQAADEGHTFLPEDGPGGLCEPDRAKDVRLSPERLRAGAESLAGTSSRLVREGGRLALRTLWECEDRAAKRLLALAEGSLRDAPLFTSGGIVGAAGILEPLGFESLTMEQAEAVAMAQVCRLMVVTGGPGTGKTYSLKAMLNVWQRAGLHVELAAPTGKAAQRMAELTGMPARTIHRLLGWTPEGWSQTEMDPICADVVVIDETSMVDVELADALLAAIDPRRTRLVLIGDVDQLPSVGPGQVLGDLIASGACPVVSLNWIMRQEAGSAIIQAAHAVNRGSWEPPSGGVAERRDLYWEAFPDGEDPEDSRRVSEDIARRLVRCVTVDLPGSGFDALRDVQVLCPQKRGAIGTEALNVEMQRILNPPAAGKGEVTIGPRAKPQKPTPTHGRKGKAKDPDKDQTPRVLREGDRVIQTSNNYGLGVFNGEIGFVVAADPGEPGSAGAKARPAAVQVDFGRDGADGATRVLDYTGDDIHGLRLAYALTVHKSQGSEFPCVVLPLHTSHYMMLRRRLLYTGLTRARELCLMLGTPRALKRAVTCNEEAARCTRLGELLREGRR